MYVSTAELLACRKTYGVECFTMSGTIIHRRMPQTYADLQTAEDSARRLCRRLNKTSNTPIYYRLLDYRVTPVAQGQA